MAWPDGSRGGMKDRAGKGRQPDSARPVLSVIRGNPSDAEVAAVVSVLAARAAAAAAAAAAATIPAAGHRSAWSAKYRMLRPPLHRGPGGWRASALPR